MVQVIANDGVETVALQAFVIDECSKETHAASVLVPIVSVSEKRERELKFDIGEKSVDFSLRFLRAMKMLIINS